MKEILRDAAEKDFSQTSSGKKAKTKKGRFQSGVIRSRLVPPVVVEHFVSKIKSLNPHIEEIMQAEEVARLDRIAEMEATKAENMIVHSDEILKRPRREWFTSSMQKKMTRAEAAEKQKSIAEQAGKGTHRMTRQKRRAREAREAVAQFYAEGDVHNDDIKDKARTLSRLERPPTEGSHQTSKRKKIEREEERLAMRIDTKGPPKKKRRAIAGDALGDSSLFSTEESSHARKKTREEVTSKVER